jgi:hypothetical protein
MSPQMRRLHMWRCSMSDLGDHKRSGVAVPAPAPSPAPRPAPEPVPADRLVPDIGPGGMAVREVV